MPIVEQIKPENFNKIKEIYEDFRLKSLTDYNYTVEPVEFEQFITILEEKILEGLIYYESEDSKPSGLLIYFLENHKIIEVNVIHTISEQNENQIRYALMQKLINLLQNRKDWQAISYPMLGKQETFIKDITHLNFKLVGQMVNKFDFKSPIAFRVFKQVKIPELQNYKISFWDEKYKEQVIELIHLGFKNSKIINFDPRFSTYNGSEEVLNMILTDQFGTFLPYQSRLILQDDVVEGFCLATMAGIDKINIPLISVRKHIRNKGVGKLLLKSVLTGFINLIREKRISLAEINAATDTDNYPAVNMYRKLGFKEDYFYAHAYYKNENYE